MLSAETLHVLEALTAGEPLTTDRLQILTAASLSDSQALAAFEVQPAQVEAAIEAQVHLLQRVWPQLQAHSDLRSVFAQPADVYLEGVWRLWLPLALHLAQIRQQNERPIVQGVLGGQGTGKSTMGVALSVILEKLGLPTVSWSIDDLYKPYAELQQLAAETNLKWRGPPGTHDVNLGIAILDRLRGGELNVPVPRFDKSMHNGAGDRTAPQLVSQPQVILFDGWFVGYRPIEPARFETAPDPIKTEADRTFARECNDRLRDYLPLWQRLDRLLVLTPINYRLSLEWRKQAEHERIARGGHGMSDADITAFVHYFWKALHPDLFLPSLLQISDAVDLVVELQPNRRLDRIYRT